MNSLFLKYVFHVESMLATGMFPPCSLTGFFLGKCPAFYVKLTLAPFLKLF